MIQLIMELLQKRKPDAPQEWRQKIPEMARRLEDSLYRSAKSREYYNDNQTLKQRLQYVATQYQKQRVDRVQNMSRTRQKRNDRSPAAREIAGMAVQEDRHLAWFNDEMSRRGVRPTLLQPYKCHWTYCRRLS